MMSNGQDAKLMNFDISILKRMLLYIKKLLKMMIIGLWMIQTAYILEVIISID